MSADYRRVILSDSDEENSPPATQSSMTAEASQPPEKRKRVYGDYEDARKFDAEQFEEWWSEEKEKWMRKDNSYEVAKSIGEHQHNEENALTHEVKSLIRDLLADGKTPGQVRNKLSDKGLTPTLKQIENFIAREKRKVDTTFGMLWNAFPIQMVGFSDAKKRFHPTAIAVISSECNWTYEKLFKAMEYHQYKPSAVLGDGAASITHATVTVFPEALRLMCWYHAQKAMSRNFKSVDSDTRKAIMTDIHALQLCTDASQFERAAAKKRGRPTKEKPQIRF